MQPFKAYPVLAELLAPLRRSQQKTLALLVAAIVEAGTARTLRIAAELAAWLDIRLDSALNRLYRALRNPRIDWLALQEQLLRLLGKRLGPRLLIAIDWTEWHPPLRMLLASVVVDRRAIVVQAEAFDRQQMPRSQNARENTFVRLLAATVHRAGLQAVLLCDRGFRRVSWLSLLQSLRMDFVVRLMDDVTVHSEALGQSMPLKRLGLRRGQVLDLGHVELHREAKVTVRVVGLWSKGAKEPWWLATSLQEPVERIVAYYDRRMAIEEQIRDQKGCRFGVKLYWTQFRNPEHLARFTRLVGLALCLWYAAGVQAARKRPSLRLPDRRKGPRRSYLTIGIAEIRRMRRRHPMTAQRLLQAIPPPSLRIFDWIAQALAPPTPSAAQK